MTTTRDTSTRNGARTAARLGSVILLTALTACAREPRLARLTPESRVLAFGDSLTFGTGAAPAASYPARLAQRLGCSVINAGVPGEVSSDGLTRLPQLLAEHQPQLLILCHGGNDMLRGLPRNGLRHNLERMIAIALEHKVDVLLLGVPQPGLLLRVPDLYRDVADKHAVLVDDSLIRYLMKHPQLKSDRIHPNAEGYRYMADEIADIIRRASD